MSTTWQVTDWWSLHAWLALQRIALHVDPSHFNTHENFTHENFEDLEGDSPEVKFHIRSYLDLPHDQHLDTLLYYVDNVPNQQVPDYLRLDLHLAWQLVNDIEVSLAGQNLLDPERPEIGNDFAGVSSAEVERSFYFKLIWEF